METKLKEFKPIKIIIGSSSGQFNHLEYYKMLIKKNAVQFVPHFFITKEGILNKLADITTPSIFTTYELVDNESISIELENIGLLNYVNNNVFIDVFGNIYNSSNITTNYFRGGKYWEEYTDEQFKTLDELIDLLTTKYNINKGINDVVDSIPMNDNGIIFRSNVSFIFNDPNKNILKWKTIQEKF